MCRSDSSPAQSVGQVGRSTEYIACRICHGVDIDVRLVESVEQYHSIGSVGIKLVDQCDGVGQIAAQFHNDGDGNLFLDTAYDIDMTLFERTALIFFFGLQGKDVDLAMAAAHYKLDNLCVLLDYNGLQIDGTNDQVMGLGNIVEKFKAFGFECFEVDGHNIEEIDKAIEAPVSGKPKFICCHTIKGKGVSFMENQVGWHGRPLKPEEFETAMKELEA